MIGLLLALLACGSSTSISDPTAQCRAGARVVSVGTAAELTDALNNAQPGDTIAVAPGTYVGRWTIARSGTSCAPITLTGPRMAILRGPDLTGTGLYLDGIQAMAGTTGNLIRGDTIDGAAMVAIRGAPPHWILAMGNDMVVDSNLATNALTQGMKVRRSSTAPTWGSNIVFSANHMTMGSRAEGYPAIYLETEPAQGMVVKCDNVRTDPGTLANLACTP